MRDEANRVAAAKVLKDALGSVDRSAREALSAAMEVGDVIAARIGNVTIGKVTKRSGSVRASVTDERALLRFVRKERPDEIKRTTTTTVRELHLKHLLERACEGEIIPGIELFESPPTLALTGVPKDVFGLVMDAIRSGEVSIDAMKEIEQ